MAKRLLYTLIFSFLFVSCNKVEEEIAPTTTPQTTLMYMTGTDLSSYYNQNITAAKTAIGNNSLGYGRFLIFKHSDSNTASLVEYKYSEGSCISETIKEYEDITSLSLEAITEVMEDVKDFAPADSYNLIVSGHATAWIPKERESDWTKVATLTDGTAQSSTDEINWEAMNTSQVVTRYLGSKNDNYFDINELKESLEATETHFKCIIFDQCFMSSIEVLYDLRNTCDYIIASPCEIMGAGFPYDTVIPQLYTDRGRSSNYAGVCEAYYNYYSSNSFPSGCVAYAVTAELETLANVSLVINHNYASEVNLEWIQAYERLDGHLFFDLEQYMIAKCNNTAVAEYFAAQMALAFPYDGRYHTERFFANIGVDASSSNNYDEYFTTIEYYSGVTTSAPSSRLTDEWAQTQWAIDTN